MKILIAPDSFKESLDAVGVAQAIQEGVKAVLNDAETILLPIADGGEGTVAALVSSGRGKYADTWVQGPLGDPVSARWGVLPDNTAVIEMAAASGLPLIPKELRNPLLASTYGTGQLIKAALDRGCSRIILGLGGSATNDGGAGALSALGARLLDARGREISANAQGLLELDSIDLSVVDPRLAEVRVDIACDVTNPLLGPQGASRIFGPQKGADPDMVEELERALARLAQVARRDLDRDIAGFPGSGAAGGLAAGLSLVADIKLRPGIELVLETMDFAAHLEGADLVFTAEGRIDSQSAMGKAISGIARLSHAAGVPVIALCGTLGRGYQEVYKEGVTAVLPIIDAPMSLEQAMAETARLLSAASSRALRLLLTPVGCQGKGKGI
ncbi:MAG: glycerate kinase [Bacillota bacterium]